MALLGQFLFGLAADPEKRAAFKSSNEIARKMMVEAEIIDEEIQNIVLSRDVAAITAAVQAELTPPDTEDVTPVSIAFHIFP